MADPAPRKLTYADLLAASTDGGPVPELMDGHIVYRAAPRFAHSRAQHQLAGVLHPMDGGPDAGWWLLVEPDVRFGPFTVLRPDLAGWRRERLPDPPEGAIEVAPDWVCEVLSPGHENHDRITKLAVYHEHGVPWVWLLHPEERRLEVLSRAEAAWMLAGAFTDGAVERIPPFEDVQIDVGGLFVPRDDLPDVVSDMQVAYRARAIG